MRLFLDTSVLLSAAASVRGASRVLFRSMRPNGWHLITTPYVVEEVVRNLPSLPPPATANWAGLRRQLILRSDVLTVNLPVVFPVAKDRPILFSALAWADVLLTLDSGDFGTLLEGEFYGLPILTPGAFLERERNAGRLQLV